MLHIIEHIIVLPLQQIGLSFFLVLLPNRSYVISPKFGPCPLKGELSVLAIFFFFFLSDSAAAVSPFFFSLMSCDYVVLLTGTRCFIWCVSARACVSRSVCV